MKFSDLQRVYERVLCQVQLPGTEETTRVVFRSFSPVGFSEFFKSMRDGSLTMHTAAARVVTAMPDLTDGGVPVRLTREVFDRFDVFVVQALVGTFIGLHTHGRTDPAGGWSSFAPMVAGEPCGLVEEWRGED